MMDALKRVWNPDTYDIDGNPEDAIMERRGGALERFEKKQRKENEAKLKKEEKEPTEVQKK